MISLSKGQGIDLSKRSPGLRAVTMGLGWDAAKPSGFLGRIFGGVPKSIDLDASCLAFDERKSIIDVVWFRNLTSNDQAIQHTGDNLTGDGDGDDEQIKVNLERLDHRVKTLVFTVNSFQGQTFDEVENATCRLLNASNEELCTFTLAEKGRHTGVIMASVTRSSSGWTMKALGVSANGRTAQDMAQACLPLI